MSDGVRPKSIRFSVPILSPGASEAFSRAAAVGAFGSRGPFTDQVEKTIIERLGCTDAILTNSGSMALLVALSALNLDRQDLVLIPSFCFVAVPQAVVLAGGTPYFVDVDPLTGSLDPNSLRNVPTERVRGVVVVHYAGIAADMSQIIKIAAEFEWFVLEDSAHSFGGRHELGVLGSLGSLAILSFDHQKNLQVGEAGAVIVNDESFLQPARRFATLGTNVRELDQTRRVFDWVSRGQRASPPDYVAAILINELDNFTLIQSQREEQWNHYAKSLKQWAGLAGVKLPEVPPFSTVLGWHIFWVTFENRVEAESFIVHMSKKGIDCRRHYSSLSKTSAGRKYDRQPTPSSDHLAESLVRLPMGRHLGRAELEEIVGAVTDWKHGELP